MNAMRRLALAAALPALLSCGVSFAPQYLVGDLRILAARVEVKGAANALADGDTGDTLVLSALVANPQGLAPLTVAWKACFPVSGQAVPPCLDASYLRDPSQLASAPGVVDLGQGLSVEMPVPPDLSPYLADLVARAQSQPAYACTLYAEIPVLAIATAGTEQQTAVKRVRVTPYRELAGTPLQDAYVPNLDPALAGVLASLPPADCAGGAPALRACATDADCRGVACLPVSGGSGAGACDDPMAGDEVKLCAVPAGGSAQGYFECNADGTRIARVEGLTYQWYTTAGTFGSRDATTSGSGNQTGDRVTFFPPSGPFTLWVIVRDDRDGVGWLQRDFR